MIKYKTQAASDMILPASIDTPRIEMTEWGARLPDQRYFPMYLSNGRDTMLINICGSGDGHWDGPVRSANPLSRLLNVGWYKADRREKGNTDLVYGLLMPFVEFQGWPIMRDEEVVPRDVRQFFDPRTATLTTFLSQQDNRSDEWLRLRIQTWLTSDGLLVQTVDCLAVPDCGVRYAFSMNEPSADYLNTKVPAVRPAEASFAEEGGGEVLRYRSKWEQGIAEGFSMVGGSAVEQVRPCRPQRQPSCLEVVQITAPCKAGDSVWRILSIQDNREGGDPGKACAGLLKRIRTEGIGGLRDAHCAGWEAYFGTSRVSLPDPAAQYLYEVSRYVIKANLHPCGFLPIGHLPFQWQGAMFWDAAFAHQAFLGCGNFNEASSEERHLMSLEAPGREQAKALGSPGIRIEWTVHLDAFTKYDPPVLQVHNNAVWARCFLLLADYAGQAPEAGKLAFVRELLVFLIDRFSSGNKDALIGIDESYSDPKPNDTWTIAATLRALVDYESCCRRWGLPLDIEGLPEARSRLAGLLALNTDASGVLQSFTGGHVPHWGSLVFDIFPDSPAALPTLAKMSRNYSAEFDLFNFHGLNRYAERAFPWANNWVARCLARAGRPEALGFWLNNTRSTNHFGGVPERVWYHGENYIDWCLPGHASQVWAMNGMLADCRDGTLTLLGGIDPAVWPDLSFEDIHAGGGVAVSLTLQAGRITSIGINNRNHSGIKLSVRAPHHGYAHAATVPPGISSLPV